MQRQEFEGSGQNSQGNRQPIIDNGKNSEKTSQAEIIHDKLNTLMALITNPDNEDHQDNNSPEDGELEEDGLVYFKSI